MVSLIKWFFIFDLHDLVRWLSVYIQDSLGLPITCPQLYGEVDGGNFVVQISGRQFSRIHFHQPNKKTIKYIREPIDFVNCASDELQSRWEIPGPKISEYLRQVENKILKRANQNGIHNHEYNPSHNTMFRKDYISSQLVDCPQTIHFLRTYLLRSEQGSHLVRSCVLSLILCQQLYK